ncbi:MAG: arginine--tRNA ligase, partial [Acidimicrobiia bacterium]
MFPAALAAAVSQALSSASADGSLPSAAGTPVAMERPRDPAHGDWSTNVALAAAKTAGKPPREVARAILDHLPEVPHLLAVEIAGPGFINFRLGAGWLEEIVRAAVGDGYGRSGESAGRVQVEFVSVNPNGPIHIGHGRGGVLGDALCNILDAAGYTTEREYYFNDAGVQMDLYAASVEARYLQALGREAAVPDDGYHGDYIRDWGSELAGQHPEWAQMAAEERRRLVYGWGLERAMGDIRETLDVAGIRFDVWFSERTLHERSAVDAALDVLTQRGHTYRDGGALWFRTTSFGDEKDRVVVKADGAYTYVAPDIAYHYDKLKRGFDLVINIWGADHHGYIRRLKAGIEALGYDPERLEVIITQLVNVTRGGKPVRMSTRAGDFVTFREVLDEVGVDAARYFLLAYSPDTTINFDLEVAKKRSMDNPVYYLQYAHARVKSLQRVAAEAGVVRCPFEAADLHLLGEAAEADLIRQIGRLPEEVVLAARRRAPHRVVAYAAELAGAFHKFYTDCRVLTDDA